MLVVHPRTWRQSLTVFVGGMAVWLAVVGLVALCA